ncbi:MAG: metallophosphoesterase [Saprospiraceae bacterium]|nr:metallophosphoesterase [Saprospiraceae bacterium]
MKKISKFLLLISLGTWLNSCATYDKSVSSHVATDIPLPGKNIYLIGDAGLLNDGKPSAALTAIRERLKEAQSDDVILFLGDNIYPSGMPEDKADGKRKAAEESLQAQIDVAKEFNGKAIFIPGNHDWYSGTAGLEEQQKIVEKALGKKSFMPGSGCPLDKFEVSEEIVIITFDSEWYLADWDKHPKINDDCPIKSREGAIAEFKSLINHYQDKTIIVAIHHPLASNGSHGGQYPLNPLKVPLNLIRRTSGAIPEDSNHPLYRALSNKITTILQGYTSNSIVVSGHDHNLQYLMKNGIPQIISGAGSKVNPVRHYKNCNGNFGYAGEGYAILNIQSDQQTILFYDAQNQLIHSRHLRAKDTENQTPYADFPTDSLISASIYNAEEDNLPHCYRSGLCHLYKSLYYDKHPFSVANLDTLYGGLKPIKLGGGNQSISLRLEDAEGKQYVMRRLRKSAIQFIQAKAFEEEYIKDRLENTIAESFLMNFYTSSFPFAALVIGNLSHIVGVYHANPKIYYVPKQKVLERYNNMLGDDVYLIEEHISREFMDLESFGASDDIVSTVEVLDNILKDEKYTINHQQYIKTRLFDMWVGDWDRHEDQYRWATYTHRDGSVSYSPIPRDRDQAFPKFDGFFTSSAVQLVPSLQVMQSFEDNIKNIKTFNQVIYRVDKSLIQNSQLSEWIEAATYLENNLTDASIDSAFSNFPALIDHKPVQSIIANLKDRRVHIAEWAEAYYHHLNHNVIVTGTEKDDIFEVLRLENGHTQVIVRRQKSSPAIGDTLFNRIFSDTRTQEIWLYGLDDRDQFAVKGPERSSIKIRMIGGQNLDSYSIENPKNIKVYDYKTKASEIIGKRVNTFLTDDYDINNYNFHKYLHNTSQITPSLGYSPDEGLILGSTAQFTRFGFENNPFSYRHTISAGYFTATNGFAIKYTGEFANLPGKSNLRLHSRYTTPAFSKNFFGYGNETVNLEDELGAEYYRTRIEQLNLNVSVVRKGSLGSEWTFSLPMDYIHPSDQDNRFAEDYLTPEQLRPQSFMGLESSYLYENKNNKSYPTLGLKFSIITGWKSSLSQINHQFGYLTSSLQIDYPLLKNRNVSLSTVWKGSVISNSTFAFYQASSIGGKEGLRGFRNDRFTGRNAYYQNTDLRWSLFQFNAGILPARFGAFAGFDYGRVWVPNDPSSKWHTSFGGGIFVNSAGILSIQTSYFTSEEGGRFVFGLGFDF